jgi:hypothetical protein
MEIHAKSDGETPGHSSPASPDLNDLARALGKAEAELVDLTLRIKESEGREQLLIDQVFSAQEALANARATEEELRMQLNRYGQFYEAVQRSRAWKIVQSLRRFFGREW